MAAQPKMNARVEATLESSAWRVGRAAGSAAGRTDLAGAALAAPELAADDSMRTALPHLRQFAERP